MKFSFHHEGLSKLDCDALALALFEDQITEDRFLSEIDGILGGWVSIIIKEEEFHGQRGQRLVVHNQHRDLLSPRRLLLVGLGKRGDFDIPDVADYGVALAREASDRRLRSLALGLPAVDPLAFSRAARFVAQGLSVGSYRFDRHRSVQRSTTLTSVNVVIPDSNGLDQLSLARGQLIAEGIALARDVVNECPRLMTASHLADVARKVADAGNLDCTVLNASDCAKLKMGLLPPEADQSTPGLIHLTYRPKGKKQPTGCYVLIGSAVRTSADPADMGGAAAVLGSMYVLPSLGVQAPVHALFPTGNSRSIVRSGDVLRAMDGTTVELASPRGDIQGSLAEALIYARRLAPTQILDLAPLSSACVMALGQRIAGLVGNDLAMVERFAGAARRVGEQVWPLPLPRHLSSQLSSPVADLKSAAPLEAGTLVSGLFLKRFAGDTPWVHVDVTGPAAQRDQATGFGVASLVEYITSRDAIT